MKRYLKSFMRRLAVYILGDSLALTQSTWAGYRRDAIQLASIIDCSPEQLEQQQQHPERVSKVIKDRVCNWYLPPSDLGTAYPVARPSSSLMILLLLEL